MEQLTVGDFAAHLNEATSAITIYHGTSKVSFQTGEAALAKKALSFSASLLNSPVLPNVIKFSPFSVRFTEDGGAVLARETSGITFSKANYEDLIKLIDMAVLRVTDHLKIRGGPRAGVSGYNMPDPVLTGR